MICLENIKHCVFLYGFKARFRLFYYDIMIYIFNEMFKLIDYYIMPLWIARYQFVNYFNRKMSMKSKKM